MNNNTMENEWELNKFDEINNIEEDDERSEREQLVMNSMKKQIGNKEIIIAGANTEASTISLDIESLRKLIFEKDKTILEFQKELFKIKDTVKKEQHRGLDAISALQMEIINVREETRQCKEKIVKVCYEIEREND